MPNANSNRDSRGFLDYAIYLVNEHQSNKALNLAFSAASLAALANRPNAKSLLLRAEEQYSRAIRHVNTALRDPIQQKTDETLAAVLLLGLFETIMSRKVSMTAWGSHIDGAVMIIKMRGRNQLKTKLGHALFTAVRTQMIVNALATGKSPDWPIDNWMADAQGRDENADEVNRLALRLAELRCDVNKYMTLVARTPGNIAIINGLMEQILDIEQGFLRWEAQLPDVWRPRTVAWVDAFHGPIQDSEVFPGKVDIFSDIWICNIWNLVRVAKLFISGTIIRCAAWLHAPGDYRTTPEYAAAARRGVDAVCDTMAAIPYHLGWTSSKEFQSMFGLADGNGFVCGAENVAPRSLGAFVGIWPLFSCYCSDFSTDLQRQWAKGRLDYITNVMGLNQATTLAAVSFPKPPAEGPGDLGGTENPSRLDLIRADKQQYQLRLPSMTVKRDQFAVAMMLASQQAAAASAAAAQAVAASQAQASAQAASVAQHASTFSAVANSSPQYAAASTYSPPTANATTYIGQNPPRPPPQTPKVPNASAAGVTAYPPSASSYASGSSAPSSSQYPQSNTSGPYPPSNASTNSPPPMPATPASVVSGGRPSAEQMQLQFMAYMKPDATPDAALQAAFEEAERKQREDWERELARQTILEEERLEQEQLEAQEWDQWAAEVSRRQWEEGREERRMMEDAMQREAEEKMREGMVKGVLEGKKKELIEEATGGDSRMAELIERYMAVKMFDDI